MAERRYLDTFFRQKTEKEIRHAFQACKGSTVEFRKKLTSHALKDCFDKLCPTKLNTDALNRLTELRFKWFAAKDKNRGKRCHKLWQSKFVKCSTVGEFIKTLPNRACRDLFIHTMDYPDQTLPIVVRSEVDCGKRIPDIVGSFKKRVFLIEIKSTNHYPLHNRVKTAYVAQVLDSVKCLKYKGVIRAFLFIVTKRSAFLHCVS